MSTDGIAYLYNRVYPLTFELDKAHKVPLRCAVPKIAPASMMSASTYGVGVVLPGEWCRYKAKQLFGSAPCQPMAMSLWFHRYLIERAKIIGMKVPRRLPRICDRNAHTCLVTYQANFRRNEMVEYVKEQEAEDFETLCILLDATQEEKLVLKENWKWHRWPCIELVDTDTAVLPIPEGYCVY